MELKEQELFTVEEVAERLKTSMNHVNELLRAQTFNHVVISKRSSAGDWTAHYYFDKSVWPYGKDDASAGRKNIDKKQKGGERSEAGDQTVVWASNNEVHCLMAQEEHEEDYLDHLVGPYGWLEDATAIYIPRLAMENLEELRILSTTPEHSSPWKELPALLKTIKSTRLKAALSAYHEFYVLNKIETGKGQSEQIKIWVKARYGEISMGERNAIAAVVNLDPRRGRK